MLSLLPKYSEIYPVLFETLLILLVKAGSDPSGIMKERYLAAHARVDEG